MSKTIHNKDCTLPSLPRKKKKNNNKYDATLMQFAQKGRARVCFIFFCVGSLISKEKYPVAEEINEPSLVVQKIKD